MKHAFVRLLAVLAIVVISLVLTAPALAAPLAQAEDPNGWGGLADLFASAQALAGFGALVPVLISFGKYFNIVKDGTAQDWTVGANLLLLIGMFVAQAAGYTDLVPALDDKAGAFAQFGSALLLLLTNLGISFGGYKLMRGSFLGYSHTLAIAGVTKPK